MSWRRYTLLECLFCTSCDNGAVSSSKSRKELVKWWWWMYQFHNQNLLTLVFASCYVTVVFKASVCSRTLVWIISTRRLYCTSKKINVSSARRKELVGLISKLVSLARACVCVQMCTFQVLIDCLSKIKLYINKEEI